MRSYHAESGGGLASLVVKEHPVRQPGAHEVLIRVRELPEPPRVLRLEWHVPANRSGADGCGGAEGRVAIGRNRNSKAMRSAR